MKLAVRKEPGSVPGGGYHYMLMPVRLSSDQEAAIWENMGHVIIDVSDEVGERLLKEAGKALLHQVEVATIVEKQLHEEKGT